MSEEKERESKKQSKFRDDGKRARQKSSQVKKTFESDEDPRPK
jgi:hypothetical protein